MHFLTNNILNKHYNVYDYFIETATIAKLAGSDVAHLSASNETSTDIQYYSLMMKHLENCASVRTQKVSSPNLPNYINDQCRPFSFSLLPIFFHNYNIKPHSNMKGADEIDSKWTTPVLDIIAFHTYHSIILKIFIPNQVAFASHLYMLIEPLKQILY